MKTILVVVVLLLASMAGAQSDPSVPPLNLDGSSLGSSPLPVKKNPCPAYICSLFQDPRSLYLSAAALYTPKFDFDGALTDIATVYHKADPHDTLWPQSWINAGVPALSWQLLELGLGGDRKTAFVAAGASVDLAPTLLGPLARVLDNAGGNNAVASKLIVDPDGSGLKIGYGGKMLVIENGGLLDWKDLRIVGRWKLGYVYKFGL